VLDLDGVHAGLDLQRVQAIQADLDQLGYKGIDDTAGVQARLDPLVVSPLDGSLVDRLDQVTVRLEGKELVVVIITMIKAPSS
jgi:hypothetical protein